ncbi:O-methyltransferase involved in polyketide biosynthesis [Rivularia sp. PCC 7116]|uniref:class I SAM-dependent methyltransferase n=1 Tax=Rivularia sp. PCC 7116 TaxID=373994 RepID=UPI00029EE601|nr:polyketide biosynthesis O-methyltransferase [Rivularia sp. PCC 7116]AFY58205.1 O-methyltransferase involved in polyketide biosynthesis [Rivularia sp. PCC 7116]
MKTQDNPRNIQEILLISLLERPIDNFLTYFICKNTQGSVKEIVAGLNSRCQRLDNRKVHGLELYLPGILRLQRRFSRKSKHRNFIAASVVDNDWLNSLPSTSSRLSMLVTEGLQMYLRKQQVKQLFDKLIENFSKSQFAFDSKSSMMLKIQLHLIEHMSAKFDWSISDIREIQNWKSGCQVMEIITFANFEVKVVQRLSVNLIKRLLFKYIPLFRNSYRLAFQLT